MRITLHVYRTHDHDLMALHQTGVLSIGQAAKKAVIAYYKGEPLCISTKTYKKPDISLMPLTITFSFGISESDAEGITNWIKNIRLGYRNCYFKNVLRHYLADPGTFLFREDTWQPIVPEDTATTNATIIPIAHKKHREELIGSEWVDSVAKEKRENTHKKISDLDVLLGMPKSPSNQEAPEKMPLRQDIDEQEEDAFDPYDAYLQLRDGGLV